MSAALRSLKAPLRLSLRDSWTNDCTKEEWKDWASWGAAQKKKMSSSNSSSNSERFVNKSMREIELWNRIPPPQDLICNIRIRFKVVFKVALKSALSLPVFTFLHSASFKIIWAMSVTSALCPINWYASMEGRDFCHELTIFPWSWKPGTELNWQSLASDELLKPRLDYKPPEKASVS